MSEFEYLEGLSFTFEDNVVIQIDEVRARDTFDLWIIYTIKRPGALDQRLLAPVEEFLENFGHLFDINT